MQKPLLNDTREKCARPRVHKFLSLVFPSHTPDSSSAPSPSPSDCLSPLPVAPTRYVLEPTQLASAVHQLPRTSVADLHEGRKHLFGGRLREAQLRVSPRRGLTPPRRGGEARSRWWRFRVPVAEGGARAFHVSHALLTHLRPLFSPRSLYARDRDVPSSVVALGKVGRATQSPSAPTERGALWAQGGDAARTSFSSLPRARWSRFSKDQKGRQDLLQLQKYFKVVNFWFT